MTPAEERLRDATEELIATVCNDVRPEKIQRVQRQWDEALKAFGEEAVVLALAPIIADTLRADVP